MTIMTIIACGGRRRRPDPCSYCSRPGTIICGFPSCGKRICGQCARHAEPGVDHCRIHGIRGDVPGAVTAILLAALLPFAGCTSKNPVVPQLAPIECRPCPVGNICPQECYEE